MSWTHRTRAALSGGSPAVGLEHRLLHRAWGLAYPGELAEILAAVPYEVDREMLSAARSLRALAQHEPTARFPRSDAAAQVRRDLEERSASLWAWQAWAKWTADDPRRLSSFAASLPPGLLGHHIATIMNARHGVYISQGTRGDGRLDLPGSLFSGFLDRVADPGWAAGLTMVRLAGELRYDERVPITTGERAYVQRVLLGVTTLSAMDAEEFARRHGDAEVATTRADLVRPLADLPVADVAAWPNSALARFPAGEAFGHRGADGSYLGLALHTAPAAVSGSPALPPALRASVPARVQHRRHLGS